MCQNTLIEADNVGVELNACDPCLAEAQEENTRRESIAGKEREQRIAGKKAEVTAALLDETPELFRRTDITHPDFNATAWGKLKGHRVTEELPWVGLVGMTGRCKTRMAYLYATGLIVHMTRERKASYAFVASYEITEAVSRLNGDFSEKAEARQYLDRLRKVDVLLIDDLGKGRLSPAVASELFALIDHRHKHAEATVWTSNSPPEVFAAGLPEDIAGPFIGRINASSKIFTFR